MMHCTLVAHKSKAVVVTGCRTPFVKANGVLQKVDTVGLGCAAVKGLLEKTKLDPKEVNHMVWGSAVLQNNAHNLAREIIMDLNLPRGITANMTSMACDSGLNALAQAQMWIETGHADVVICGGSDSMSNMEQPLPRSVAYGLAAMKKKGFAGFAAEAGTDVRGWLPPMKGRADRTSGKSMGYWADVAAEAYGISRAEQEALGFASHKNTLAAEAKGYFKDEVVPVTIDVKGKKVDVITDDVIQRDLEKMKAKMPTMKPSFRPEGTITAASSSALSDGASAVLVMSEEKAKQLGYPTDISIRSWEFTGLDPYPALLLAPVLGWAPCFKRAGISVKDVGRFEVHEAFAAQVLATLKCLQSPEFFEKYAGTKEPFLKEPLDLSKMNVNGSSIAMGHPFAATGGRIVTSLSNELRRSGERFGLISICAAGGLGGVAILEHTPKK